MKGDDPKAHRLPAVVLWIVLGTFGLYLATSPIIASLAGEAITQARAWSSDGYYPAWSRPFVLLFAISGVAIALVVPALAWAAVLARAPLRPASLFHRAFALNLLQAVAFISVWKAFAGSVPARPVFIAWQACVAAAGLGVLQRSPAARAPIAKDAARPALAGVFVLLVLLPLFLWGKTFVEDSSGDGTESFEFARSLATHQLPYWDLENGYYGFYPQFMLFAYPLQLAFIAIGEGEAGQRVPIYFYLLGTYLVLVELVRGRQRRLAWAEIALLLGAAVFFLIYHGYHSTYELVSDLAEPMGVDTFFTFISASALYALLTRQRAWWGLFALFGTMALAAGLPFAALFLAGRALAKLRSVRWAALRSHFCDGLAFGVPWLGYQIFVAVYSRFHPLGTTKWSFDNLFTLYPPGLGLANAGAVAANLAVVSALVPLLGLAFLLRRDSIVRTIAVPIAGYSALLVIFGRINPHYVTPLTLLPGAILLRSLASQRSVHAGLRALGYGAYGAALLALTLFALPSDRTPHTAYREMGKHTLLRYASYPDAVEAVTNLLEEKPELELELPTGKAVMPWAKSEVLLADGFDRTPVMEDAVHGKSAYAQALWGLSQHLWVRYSDRAPVPGREYQQILSTAELAPEHMAGFSRRELPGGWVLFSRDQASIFASTTPTTR